MQKSGIDLSNRDPKVRLQDDLYRHLLGKWLKEHEIPADRSADGNFYALRMKAESQVKAIIEELAATSPLPGSNAAKIGDLFASFMNTERINSLGISPIIDDLKRALAISDKNEFIKLLGEFEAKGNGGFFYTYINSDDRDSTRNIAYLGQSGLSLPDEAYYREEQYQPLRAALHLQIIAMFNLAGISEPEQKAQAILDLETKIASYHWDQVRDRDALETYNKYIYQELVAKMPSFDWDQYLISSQTPQVVLAEVIIRQPSFFENMDQLFAQFDTSAWGAWLAWHLLTSTAPYLSDEFVQQNFEFYGKTLSGIPEIRERWKRGVSVVEGVLGEAIGELYVARHFPPAAKERMVVLVDNLLTAYRLHIQNLDWMSDETKEKALVKLSKFVCKIGYPEKFRDYSKLQISSDDLMANIRATVKFQTDYELAKIGKPVDRAEWHMYPQTVNAYYNPGFNEIVFPAGILQEPFFGLDWDDAANYGAIGAVIGHEIGHGFDDQGSQYDGDGNLNDWWIESDRTEFESRASALIEQYNQLSPAGASDIKVNGALTVGENIGDLGGITIALAAYQIALAAESAPEIDGLSGLERFFFGYAQTWQTKIRPEELRRRIATDPHSPDEFRCNQIVRNLDEFHEIFNLQPTDAMYLAPEARVKIW
jgi:putative endopeptidase